MRVRGSSSPGADVSRSGDPADLSESPRPSGAPAADRASEAAAPLLGSGRRIAARHLVLAAILAVYLALAFGYRAVVPAGYAPDEIGHVDYVRYLAARAELPVQSFERNEEASQPPLYYAVQAGWLKLLDQPDFVAARAPVAAEIAGYQALRLVSIALGALTVLLLYRLGRLVCPNRPVAGWGTAALGGLLPQFTFLTAAVNNDNAVNVLAALVLVLLVGALRAPALSWRRIVAIGLAIGVAGLAKEGGLFLLPFAAAVVGWKSGGWRAALPRIGLLVLIVAILFGPIVIRNVATYGLLSTSQIMAATLPNVRQPGPFPSAWFFTDWPSTVFQSYWGALGYLNIRLTPFYPVFLLISLAALAGVGLHGRALWRGGAGRSTEGAILLLLLGVCALYLALLAAYNLRISSPQGRHVFPALGAFSVLAVLGLVTVADRVRFVRPAPLLSAVALVLVAANVTGIALFASGANDAFAQANPIQLQGGPTDVALLAEAGSDGATEPIPVILNPAVSHIIEWQIVRNDAATWLVTETVESGPRRLELDVSAQVGALQPGDYRTRFSVTGTAIAPVEDRTVEVTLQVRE